MLNINKFISKIIKYIFFSIIVTVIMFSSGVSFVYSEGPLKVGDATKVLLPLTNLGNKGGFETTSTTGLADIIAIIIQAVLGLLGMIFLILILYAGFNWMTAAGEEEKVTKAKETLTRAIIGLIIIVSAYLITIFVFSKLPS